MLHSAVDPALHVALAGVASPQRVGKRLRRLSRRTIGGVRLVRVDRDRDGVIWTVQVVADLHTDR